MYAAVHHGLGERWSFSTVVFMAQSQSLLSATSGEYRGGEDNLEGELELNRVGYCQLGNETSFRVDRHASSILVNCCHLVCNP
jgi:hypothetical protein